MSKTKLYPVVVKYSETTLYENEVYVDEGMLNQINDGSFNPDSTFINGITKEETNNRPVFVYPDVVEEWYDEDNIEIEPIDKLKGEEVMDDYEKYRYVKVVQKDGDGYKVEPYTTVEENLIYRKKDEFSDAEIEGMIASAN